MNRDTWVTRCSDNRGSTVEGSVNIDGTVNTRQVETECSVDIVGLVDTEGTIDTSLNGPILSGLMQNYIVKHTRYMVKVNRMLCGHTIKAKWTDKHSGHTRPGNTEGRTIIWKAQCTDGTVNTEYSCETECSVDTDIKVDTEGLLR